jgi:hypothetical protein
MQPEFQAAMIEDLENGWGPESRRIDCSATHCGRLHLGVVFDFGEEVDLLLKTALCAHIVRCPRSAPSW